MSEHRNLTDDQLLAVLGEAIDRFDPVPDAVMAAARDARSWGTLDAELAELVFDSSFGLAGVRSAATADRQVIFRAPALEIEVLVADGRRRLDGQLVPPMEAGVELEAADGSRREAVVDRLGRFHFVDLRPGAVRIHVVAPAGRVTTPWIDL